MNKKGQRTSVKKQEEVVSALWAFAHDLETKEHNAKTADGQTSVNLEAVGTALECIMTAFGYQVVEIQ